MSKHSSSLSWRLMRMNLLVSGTVLLIAAVAFFSYDILSFRHNLISNLDVQAQIIGDNSISALTFNDDVSAATTLESLQSYHDIRAAVLTASDGSIFARYQAPNQSELAVRPLPEREFDHVWTSGTHVLVAHRIVFQGKEVGVVYIAATLSEIHHRARHYLLIAFTILMFCMAAGLIVSSMSRRLIADPIIALADTALRVSHERDYSVRADIQTDSSEVTVLVNAFNTMLTQIGERDDALTQARNELEVRVEDRTAELQAANRELEAFSYTVAHDLRGPLDSITSIAFLLSKNCNDSNSAVLQPMLGQLTTSTANMASLIDDLLNFARASTTAIKSATVDLSAIVREIAIELTTSEPGRQVNFTIADVPKVSADVGLMRIVLDNLLRNSWKYSSHHAQANIEFGVKQGTAVDQSAGRLIYFVRDDGAGFDPSRINQLFQPFQRLHGKGDFPGTGIGLATVQRILARQGGSIWAEGQIEKGATFYFTLG